jgi:hypothetical protein
MTQEEILDYNKRCAEFLNLHRDEEVAIFNMRSYSYDCLKFDLDWNWIMEVVDAIEKLGYQFNIYHEDCVIEKDKKFIVITHATKKKSKKEAVVQAINQFLKFYNENNS